MKQESLVVVITGASSGIGRATALEFAKRGDNVVLAARGVEGLDSLAAECQSLGGKALVVPTDVTNTEDVYTLSRRAISRFGHIDMWVNNAAVALFGRFEETPIEDIRRVIDTNVMGYIYGARAVVPHFKARGKGTLVNVSSMVGKSSQPFTSAYTISKFAIRGLSLSLEQELSDHKDIHICTVLPAVVDTPIFQHAANYYGKEIKPPKPVISAERVAKTIVALSHTPKKEVMVGSVAHIFDTVRTISPNFFDRQIKPMIKKQHFQDTPAQASHGNLYKPNNDWNSVSGGWLEQDQASKSTTSKNIAIAGAAIAGLLVGASLFMKGNKHETANTQPTIATE